MPFKRSIILQLIFAFCILCLIIVAHQANDAHKSDFVNNECPGGVCDSPSQDDPTNDPLPPPPPPPPSDNQSDDNDPSIPVNEKLVTPNDHDEISNNDFPFTIVTAASANHFCALEGMLYTLKDMRQHVRSFPRLVVYDLGTNDQQKTIMANLQQHQYFDELVTFNYSAYPAFWDITVNRGEYAWKTGIVKEVQEQYGGVIIWLDTGDVPNLMFMRMIPEYIRKYGFWSPRSTGFVGSKFNHLGIFDYLKMDRKQYAMLENCNGAALGFDTDNPRILNELVTPWYECGLDKNCIAPPGSSRQNHRQDQSAITLLAVRAGFQCFEYPEFHGVTIHQDEFCQERLSSLDKMGRLLHPSSIDL
ncbi:hypothetical protein O0I10_000485 [Lichtheimia ornata]|uniref:Uncharacterized protein n=1 Tax=Lichtheimia ornata TaxID=688661 RepID=A0AAD7Y3S0_9FUNG|nr:uncharacterized protein O0I10_000485 [Lichtheimia ornata]KAJ8663247.1 hypothetical protein O0I10_000485 [Lichtheimia ornata]